MARSWIPAKASVYWVTFFAILVVKTTQFELNHCCPVGPVQLATALVFMGSAMQAKKNSIVIITMTAISLLFGGICQANSAAESLAKESVETVELEIVEIATEATAPRENRQSHSPQFRFYLRPNAQLLSFRRCDQKYNFRSEQHNGSGSYLRI